MDRLATLSGAGRESFEKLAAELREVDATFGLDWSEVEVLVEESHFLARGTRMSYSKRSVPQWMQAHLEQERATRRRLHESWEAERISRALPRHGAAKVARWPTIGWPRA